MKQVSVMIIERKTKRVIGVFPVALGGYKCNYFDVAWECAVKDGLVDSSKKDDFDFVEV